MDAPLKNLNNEEKENVLLVLNEFSEEYKANAKSVTTLVTSVKELSEKVMLILDRKENMESQNKNAADAQDVITKNHEEIVAALRNISVPKTELHQLSGQLDKTIAFLQVPAPQKVIHHHHVPKLTWITAGLFIVMSVACSGWYMTADKLGGYISSDTKYRYLKLDTGNVYLQKLLYGADSLFRTNVSMRAIVINMEEENQHNFELLQKANNMNAEAENLKANAKTLKEKAGRK